LPVIEIEDVVQRTDLPCLTRLLFAGRASIDELANTLRAKRGMILATVERLQLAGYARFHPDDGARIELTEHARKWVERIWAPVRNEGNRLLDTYSTRHLILLATFLRNASEMQESVTKRLRSWLESPSSPARRPHLRGGLSPAALRRVQVFVESATPPNAPRQALQTADDTDRVFECVSPLTHIE
jgi:DNA-binding MarR family transcriptional regulator